MDPQEIISKANSPEKQTIIRETESVSRMIEKEYTQGLITPKEYSNGMARIWLKALKMLEA